jgi:hypothetical protein
METLATEPYNGKVGLPDLAAALRMDVDELYL